jgi:TolB-like protein
MDERNAGLPPERRIEFRMGIQLGDIVEEGDGDLMGDAVNIAARLEAVANPGSICLSEDAYRQVKGRMKLAASDLGLKELKNIAEPMRVYSIEFDAEAIPSNRGIPVGKSSERRSRSWIAILILAALTLIVAAGAWSVLGSRRVATATPTGSARLSIVVLPFANLSGDAAEDSYVNALTNQLTTALARQHESFVIARSTAENYKVKLSDAKAIGRELGVRYVLEGSVQLADNLVRVNAQLIDAVTGAHLWADQFDMPRAELFQT